MKSILTLLFSLTVYAIFCQEDVFRWNVDVSCNSVKYKEIDIINYGGGTSSLSWNEHNVINSTSFKKEFTTNNCLNIMGNFGCSVPIFKNKKCSFGIKPSFGVGKLFTVGDPKVTTSSDTPTYSYDNNAKEPISCFSLNASFVGYFSINFEDITRDYSRLDFFTGYRILRTTENYGMPVVGVEFGFQDISISVAAYFTQINYYREFSNGDKEISKQIKENGSISIHYYFKSNY